MQKQNKKEVRLTVLEVLDSINIIDGDTKILFEERTSAHAGRFHFTTRKALTKEELSKYVVDYFFDDNGVVLHTIK